MWRSKALAVVDDGAALAEAVRPAIEAWRDVLAAIEEGASFSESDRRGIACCAYLIAELSEINVLPQGSTRLDALRIALEYSTVNDPFTTEVRAYLDADYIDDLLQAGEYDEALMRIEWARSDYVSAPAALAEILLLDANTQEYLGNFAQAFASAESANAMLTSLPSDGERIGFARLYGALVQAKILIHIGVVDEASRILAEACSQARDSDLTWCGEMLLTVETELAGARGDHAWSVDHLREALSAGDSRGVASTSPSRRELDLAQSMALAAMQSGDGLEKAAAPLKDAIDQFGIDDSRTWAASLTMCDLSLALGDTAEARQRLERLERAMDASTEPHPLNVRSSRASVRGRLLLRTNASVEALDAAVVDAETALDSLLAAWRSVPHRKGGVGFLHFDERRSLLATLSQLYLATMGSGPGAERTLERLLEIEAQGSLADLLGPSSARLADVRSKLIPDRGGMIAFLPSATGSVAVTLDADGAKLWTLPGSDSWDRVSERLSLEMQPQSAMRPGAIERANKLAHRVADILLPPELAALIGTWREVVFVRAENLGWIPFEALPLSSRGGRPLGLELATSYLPSLRLGLGLIDRRREQQDEEARLPGPRVLIAVGPTKVSGSGKDSNLTLIPWRDDDRRRISATWPSDFVEVELDPNRALRRLMQANAEGMELLVVIAHGVRDSDRERSQGFAFGEEQHLFASDLDSMSAPRLTMLLVCGASAGRSRRGDDLGSHLIAAFLSGGSSAVASARTDLSFEASVALLQAFNAEIAQGHAISHALLTARQAVSRMEGWEHPAFHSTLTITGIGFGPAAASLRTSSN